MDTIQNKGSMTLAEAKEHSYAKFKKEHGQILAEFTGVFNNIEAILKELKGNGITGKSHKNMTALELTAAAGDLAQWKIRLGEIKADIYEAHRIIKLNNGFEEAHRRDFVIQELKKERGKYPNNTDIEAGLKKRMALLEFQEIAVSALEQRATNLWWSLAAEISVIMKRVDAMAGKRTDELIGELSSESLDVLHN